MIVFLALALITVTNWWTTRQIARDEATASSKLLLQTLGNSLSFMLTDCESTSRFVINDESVQKYLSADSGSADFASLERAARATLINLTIFRSAVSSIVLYSNRGHCVSAGYTNSMETAVLTTDGAPWNAQARALNGMYLWSDAQLRGMSTRVFLVRVINARDSRSPVGMVAILLNNAYINALVDKLGERDQSAFFVLSEQGQRVFGDSSPLLQRAEDSFQARGVPSGDIASSGSEEYLAVQQEMPHPGWTLVRMVDTSGIFDRYRINMVTIALVGIGCLVCAFAVYARFTHGITRDIRNLISSMKSAESEGFRRELPIMRDDEVGQLTQEYNFFMRRIDVLVNEVYEVKLRARDAEIAGLQAQINPHFLYNTLNCINWKALEQDQQEISQMVVALSKMFRYSLSNGDNDVTLRQELDNVSDYLYLQKQRFEDRLSAFVDVPEGLWGHHLPRYTLQPIVENSVIHGLGKTMQHGQIRVSGYLSGDELVLEVADNGVGVDTAYIGEILSGNVPDKNTHGVRNVNERLKLLYGPDYSLTYENLQEGGTLARIVLPGKE